MPSQHFFLTSVSNPFLTFKGQIRPKWLWCLPLVKVHWTLTTYLSRGRISLHQIFKSKMPTVDIRVKGPTRLFLFPTVFFPDFFLVGLLQNSLNTICVRINSRRFRGQTVLHGGRNLPKNNTFRNIHVISKFTVDFQIVQIFYQYFYNKQYLRLQLFKALS
jgi:hypothetical protein